jgi:NAD(P)-dependent dehydrogenase (short-subunit alcohol dehydrogenase family)
MTPQLTDISGRIVAITGAARGIGFATARALLDAGARVSIGDIDGDAAIRAAEELGPAVLASPLDVTEPGSFRDFLALTERELGPLDVLINNAGSCRSVRSWTSRTRSRGVLSTSTSSACSPA